MIFKRGFLSHWSILPNQMNIEIKDALFGNKYSVRISRAHIRKF